jgi:hypothetical protein
MSEHRPAGGAAFDAARPAGVVVFIAAEECARVRAREGGLDLR